MARYLQILILAFLLCFDTLKANDLNDVYIVIIGGGRTYEDALKAKINYENNIELKDQLISKVDLILTDTIEGLNPGFYISTIGYCEREELSDIIVRIANEYLEGVYKRKVLLDNNIILNNLIEVKVKSAPFEGISNKYRGGEIIVKNEHSFTKRIGSFDVNFYLTWNRESGYIQHLSELDFTRIPASEDDTLYCYRSEYNSDYPDTYSKTCYYPNEIESIYTQDGYGSKESMLFPLDKFSYREVLFYYLGEGYFKELLENDYFNDSTGIFENPYDDPLKEEYKIYDTGLWKSGYGFPKPTEELKTEGDYIIYEYKVINID